MKRLILFQIFVIAVISSEAEFQDFAKANNLFTAFLYKEIVKNKEPNFLISQYSLETVLAFAHSGSKGETAHEIRRALHLLDDKEQIESELSILKANCQYTLHIVNKMYVQDDFPIKDSFRREEVEICHAGSENVDFNQNTEAARKINEWNDFIEVDTMHRYSGKFNFYESPELDAKFLEMPYKGDGLSMTIVLPNDIEGLDVNVTLPKFKIQSALELRSVLKSKKTFNRTEADFTGVGGKKKSVIIVSDVVQKGYINVEEKGAEAAVATSLGRVSSPYY
ncbi:Serpin domain containing protein [Asbolus verrucosus]|uniref:Serpin domain containing protein n=1 Tax=Asbolus verrucosus TaxID=1661398 RepID=A0A482VQN4_ASBVE|nr:Serpin domain containing protein [Asbolus verrucosus]